MGSLTHHFTAHTSVLPSLTTLTGACTQALARSTSTKPSLGLGQTRVPHFPLHLHFPSALVTRCATTSPAAPYTTRPKTSTRVHSPPALAPPAPAPSALSAPTPFLLPATVRNVLSSSTAHISLSVDFSRYVPKYRPGVY